MFFGINPELFAIIVMSLLLIYRHRGNIANLMAGKETRIGQKKDSEEQVPAEEPPPAKEHQETR
jgi:glycerol-3-phosphate acyltransferase PlsY